VGVQEMLSIENQTRNLLNFSFEKVVVGLLLELQLKPLYRLGRVLRFLLQLLNLGQRFYLKKVHFKKCFRQ
jgi:hypothetical protein